VSLCVFVAPFGSGHSLKWNLGAINETDALNLGAEAIINMSQDIVADQLENDKYPSVKALFDYVGDLTLAWRRKMRPLMQVPKLMRRSQCHSSSSSDASTKLMQQKQMP
jgi:hypothetical protein